MIELGDKRGRPTSEFIFLISLHRFFNICTFCDWNCSPKYNILTI
jgi:hypothetical protein